MATIPKNINKLQKDRWAKFEKANLGTVDDIQVVVQGTVTDILINFINAIKDQLKENINATSKTGQQSLYNSIQINVENTGNSIAVQLVMNDYWKYLDKGVKGRKSTYAESSDSPYQYPQSPKSSGGKFQSSLELWIAQKPIQIRTSASQSGKEVRQINSSVAYLMRRSILNKGIKATNFFSSVLNSESTKQLIEEVEKQLGTKIELGLATFKQ